MRVSLSEYERSSAETSLWTSSSSSLARASARSMPSPTAATSRRMAWLTLTTASVAMFSGSESRCATSVIERADDAPAPCVRHIIEATAQMKAIGYEQEQAALRTRGELRKSPSLKTPFEIEMAMTRTPRRREAPIATG